ncbi:MAG: outer membrane protein TolC [Planctomycetota bacterium]|jgi:outer membrane protein TolC
MRHPILVLFLLALFTALSGCLSPDEYEAEADRVAYGVVDLARLAADQDEDLEFSINKPENRLRDTLIVARSLDDDPGPRERLALEGAEVVVDLASALEIAARNSREYQTEKERLFASALSFSDASRNFESRWFGLQSFDGNARGDNDDGTDFSVAENGSVGFTRLLEAGGALSLSIGDNITRFLSNPASTVATTFATLSLSIPFLRGAGREIAYNNVTQAERNVVYAVRNFERFKRTFGVNIISQYMRLLRNYQTAQNEKENYKRRQVTALENRARGEAGRLSRTDVERANNAELDAENRAIIATQNFQNSLDNFKLTLGLPTDVKLTIDTKDLVTLREEGADPAFIPENDAMVLAITNRLDLAVTHGRAIDSRRLIGVARNALLAGVDLNVSADFNSNDFGETSFRLDPVGNADYNLGLDIDLPFDRVNERNAYRQSLINYQASLRNYEAQEDGVKLDIRAGLRSLQQAAETYRIQILSLGVSETNVDATNLLKDAGQGTTLDLLLAQNDLILAENAVLSSLINFKIAKLELLRDMGILVVTSSGIDEELTNLQLKKEG